MNRRQEDYVYAVSYTHLDVYKRQEKGEVIVWSKDKYNLFRQQVKDSFVADCAMAVLKALENCISKEKFIEKMKQFGWNVNWTEKRKHITFQNQDGKKVRDSNLSKTFHLDISKEGLVNEFNGNYERVRAEAERTNGADEELAGYYRQVEAACEGAGGLLSLIHISQIFYPKENICLFLALYVLKYSHG